MQKNETLSCPGIPRTSIQLRPPVYSPERSQRMAYNSTPKSPKSRKSDIGWKSEYNTRSADSHQHSGGDFDRKQAEDDASYSHLINESSNQPKCDESPGSSGVSGTPISCRDFSRGSNSSSPDLSPDSIRYPQSGRVQEVTASEIGGGIINPVIIVPFLILVVGYIYSTFINQVDTYGINQVDNYEQLKETIEGLKEKYPSQNEKFWRTLYSGIKTIVSEEPSVPSVFLLLYDDTGIAEKQTSVCLAKEVGRRAAEFLSQAKEDPIFLEGETLQNSSLINDYGQFISDHERPLEEKHVMIVHNLQDVPAVVAQCFHTLCDKHSPFIGKAAYLFTLKIRKNIGSSKATDIAERTLRSLWEKYLDKDIVDPLITRITDTVLSITSEKNPPC